MIKELQLMKRTFLSLSLCLVAFIGLAAQSGIYVGGPSYYERDFSILELKKSGFTNVVVWTIHVGTNGDLNLNTEFTICSAGEYIGDRKYPNFASDIKMLKAQPTNIDRIEIGLSAWASNTYNNIRDLIAKEGTGPESILYKNFKALKEAIPEIDALNNDDEGTYDLSSTVSFSIMCADLGFKNALCPYTNQSYWTEVAKQVNEARPGNVDAVYLQCYAGGSGNNPVSWQTAFDTIPVYGGLWAGPANNSLAQIESSMQDWANDGIEGGFIWLYDDFKNSNWSKDLATAMNGVFNISDNTQDVPFPPTSPTPKDMTKGLSSSVELSWNVDSKTTSSTLYFGSEFPLQEMLTSSENEYTVDELEDGKMYFWRVDASDGINTTLGMQWAFSTIKLPKAPTYLSPENGAYGLSTEVEVSFEIEEGEDIKFYNVYYGIESVSENKKTSLGTKYKIKNLKSNATYKWQVGAENADGETLGEVWEFTTNPSSIYTHKNEMFTVYPVPFNNEININGLGKVETVQIYNITGENVIDIHQNAKSISTTHLPTGIYMIVINNKYTIRVVKQ